MKYYVVDNGLRCLVPPCEQWDILDEQGRLLTRVSSVQDTNSRPFDVSNKVLVSGKLVEYEVLEGPNKGVRSRRLIVESTE